MGRKSDNLDVEIDRLLNKKEVAHLLNVSVYTIDNWVSQKREIPVVRLGARVLFDPGDIKKWIESKKVQPRNLS